MAALACGDDDSASSNKPDGGEDDGGSAPGGSGGKGGDGGNGGSSGSKADAGSARCGSVTCDSVATCDRSGSSPKCVCPDGYDDKSGFGTRCVKQSDSGCSADADCDSGHCVDGVCCASACDEPGACETAEGASCEDGETCVYPQADNGTSCDDGDACTENDSCTDGSCDGSAIDCDDDNVCTADSCDPESGCVNDGTDITTEGCAPDTNCAQGFACLGNKRGDCEPTTEVDCTSLDDQCNVGICDESDGSCNAVPVEDGTACNDEDECNVGETCQSGACTGGSARDCNDNNVCTDDSCDVSLGCLNAPNAGSCDDDNPCTTGDHCALGACTSSGTKSCSGQDDQCNVGVCNPSDGSCGKMPKEDGTACNDGKVCTSGETCHSGTCSDSNTDSACGPGSTGCTEGANRTCTCESPDFFFDSTNHICVANVCDAGSNPCDSNATCTPVLSNNTWSASCTCNAGYSGNGTTCTDINECAANPCKGHGSCTEGTPPTYTCSCDSGYTQINPGSGNTCACDLNGTFAIRITTNVSWPDTIDDTTGDVVISAGSATTTSWAIRTQVYDSDGTLHASTQPCGGTSPTLCGTGATGLVPAEAYSQFLANQIFGTLEDPGTMPVEDDAPLSIPNALPGEDFVTAETASVSGIHLTNELGTWPSSRAQVGTAVSPSSTNGAYWRDDDSDGKRGVTSYATQPPNGVSTDAINGVTPTPTVAYPTTACGGESYNWWPVPGVCDDGCISGGPLTVCVVCRAKAFYLATRIISSLDGTFTSCNLITGSVKGPDSGQMKTDGRIGGCMVRTGGSGSSTEVDCDSSHSDVIDFVDGQPQTQKVDSATFVIRRVPQSYLNGGLSCDELRAANFPWSTP